MKKLKKEICVANILAITEKHTRQFKIAVVKSFIDSFKKVNLSKDNL